MSLQVMIKSNKFTKRKYGVMFAEGVYIVVRAKDESELSSFIFNKYPEQRIEKVINLC